jgi:two-component system, NtrC family, sensor kinase
MSEKNFDWFQYKWQFTLPVPDSKNDPHRHHCVLTPMILVSTMILGEFKQSYREKVYAHLSLQILKHKTIIDNFLTERLNNIQHLTESCDFELFMDENFLETRLAILQNTYGIVFEDLGLIDEQGIQVAYAGPYKLVKAEYADAEWFNEAIKQDNYISDVFLGLRRLPHFIVSVKKNDGEKTWLLRSTINFTAFNDLVENLQIGKTGFAFIVNREGNFQTKPKSDAITAKQLSLILSEMTKILMKLLSGKHSEDQFRKKSFLSPAF